MNSVTEIITGIEQGLARAIGRAITLVENQQPLGDAILERLASKPQQAVTLGITGPPGAGKSTLTSCLIKAYRQAGERVGIIAIDPTSPFSGGAILGDRVRMMTHATDPQVVIRSMATRGRLGGLCSAAGAAIMIMAASGCGRVIIETVGVGQSEMDIVGLADLTLLTLAPGLGDEIQAMKAGVLEVADLLVVNKDDLPGADALVLDLHTVAHSSPQRAAIPLCRTIADQGKGIGELVKAIQAQATALEQQGELLKRRQQRQQQEVVDWALELLRPQLHQGAAGMVKISNPRQAAATLLGELGLVDNGPDSG